MLGYIKGKILAIIPNGPKYANLVIWPYENTKNHDSSGVGYSVIVPEKVASTLTIEQPVSFWIFHYITERDSLLLGITSLDKLKLFYKVIGVSGIGPKVALALVEFFDKADILLQAIKNKDTDTISKVPGLGKKTAAKLVISLISSIDSLDFIPQDTAKNKKKIMQYPQYNLIVGSLKNLGFSKQEIDQMIGRVESELETAILSGKDIEFLLKLVLSVKK